MKALVFKTTLLICFCTFILSCKKDKAVPVDTSTTTQNISNDSINGELSVKKNYVLNNDSLVFSHIQSFAQFFQVKTSKYSTTNPPNVNVGNVLLNGVQFLVQPSPYNTYIDTTGTFFMMPYTWQISGNTTHPAFNFTNNTNFPIYSKIHLPDTLTISQQDTIKIGNYSASWVKVSIQSSAAMLVKSIEYPSNQVIIQPNEIYYSGLGNEQGWIFIDINNSYYKSINGRMYRFNSITSFYKSVILKP